MYEKLVAQGLGEEELQVEMNIQCKALVRELLKKEEWEIKGEVAIYQDSENPHLWNVYDNEPDSLPTIWTFQALTQQLVKRV